MKLGVAIPSPEVQVPVPLALFTGPFAERVHNAAKLGYDGLELVVARPGEISAAEVCEQVSAVGLEIAAIGLGAVYMTDRLTLLSSDPHVSRQAETRLHEAISLAAQLRAPLVTVGRFRGCQGQTEGRPARSRLVQILGEAANHAATEGVRLVIEPLNRYESDIINTASEGLDFIRETQHSHLGLLLDAFHANIEEPSMHACFQEAMSAGCLWYVHLGDSNRLSPGKGHIDFSGIVAVLHAGGYQGYLSAEHLSRPDGDEAAAETVKHMRQWVPAHPSEVM